MLKLTYSETVVNVNRDERRRQIHDIVTDMLAGNNTGVRTMLADYVADGIEDQYEFVVAGRVAAKLFRKTSFELPFDTRLIGGGCVHSQSTDGELYVDHHEYGDFSCFITVKFTRPSAMTANIAVVHDHVCEEFVITEVVDAAAVATAFGRNANQRRRLSDALALFDKDPRRYLFDTVKTDHITGFSTKKVLMVYDDDNYAVAVTPHDNLIVVAADANGLFREEHALVDCEISEPLRSIARHAVLVNSSEVVEFLGNKIIVDDARAEDRCGEEVDYLRSAGVPYVDADYLVFTDLLFINHGGDWVRLITPADESRFVADVVDRIEQRVATLNVLG